jgi:putative intracellular protease/amidase
MRAHPVSFLIYPGISPFDVAGPAKALERSGMPYEVTVLSTKGGLIESDCLGVSLSSLASVPGPDEIDTLFICGGSNAQRGRRSSSRSH